MDDREPTIRSRELGDGLRRVTGTERHRLLALCGEQHIPGWFQQHGVRLPPQLVTYIDDETKAVGISEFQEPGVPDILQTGDYAHAVLSRSGTVPALEHLLRMSRRHFLTLSHAAGGAGRARRARWDGWGVHVAGVRRFPAGRLSGE